MTPLASAVGAILAGTATAQITDNMWVASVVFFVVFAAAALVGHVRTVRAAA
jgi:hypothetical protein